MDLNNRLRIIRNRTPTCNNSNHLTSKNQHKIRTVNLVLLLQITPPSFNNRMTSRNSCKKNRRTSTNLNNSKSTMKFKQFSFYRSSNCLTMNKMELLITSTEMITILKNKRKQMVCLTSQKPIHMKCTANIITIGMI